MKLSAVLARLVWCSLAAGRGRGPQDANTAWLTPQLCFVLFLLSRSCEWTCSPKSWEWDSAVMVKLLSHSMSPKSFKIYWSYPGSFYKSFLPFISSHDTFAFAKVMMFTFLYLSYLSQTPFSHSAALTISDHKHLQYLFWIKCGELSVFSPNGQMHHIKIHKHRGRLIFSEKLNKSAEEWASADRKEFASAWIHDSGLIVINPWSWHVGDAQCMLFLMGNLK